MTKKPDAIPSAEKKGARVYANVQAKLARLNAKYAPQLARRHVKYTPLLKRCLARLQKIYDDPAVWRGIVKGLTEERRHRKSVNRKNARQPRGKQAPSLARRGLQCVLREKPDITADTLTDWLEGQSQTYDDNDIELSLDGDAIVVRDLRRFGKTKSIKKSALRMALKRARNN